MFDLILEINKMANAALDAAEANLAEVNTISKKLKG